MPLRLPGGNSPRRAARCWIDEGGVMGTTTQKMTDEQQRGAFTRRQFLTASGVLVVGFSIASWVMIAADELDVPLNRVQVRFGDTAATPDQGGTGGSNGISSVYNPLRQACATARQALLKMASAKLDVSVESLTVKDGVVSGSGGAKSVSYGELIGDHQFDLKFSNTAPVKDPSQYKIVGKTTPQRPEIAKIVTAGLEFTQDVRTLRACSIPGTRTSWVNSRPCACREC